MARAKTQLAKSSASEARSKSMAFKERFQGRISHISKDGELGVVAATHLPIKKLQPTGSVIALSRNEQTTQRSSTITNPGLKDFRTLEPNSKQ